MCCACPIYPKELGQDKTHAQQNLALVQQYVKTKVASKIQPKEWQGRACVW